MSGQTESTKEKTGRSGVPRMAVLGIDTCGPSGSVALVDLSGADAKLLGQTLLEGRTYSSTIVAASGALLEEHGLTLHELRCIVVVSGPGSFTGVRVGLSAAKGLSEGAGVPLIAVSRLAVLADKAGVANAVLDAHRREVFLRLSGRELLASSTELAAEAPPAGVAVADDAAASLVAQAWPAAELVRVDAPTAADAIRLAISRIDAEEYNDTALLDGHYLRRSDAEIFGDSATRL